MSAFQYPWIQSTHWHCARPRRRVKWTVQASQVEEHPHPFMEKKAAVPQSGFHGVLGYSRESEWRKSNLQPPSTSDHTVLCEICGAKAKPLLDFSKTLSPEDFCCPGNMEVFKKLEQEWHLLQGHCAEYSQEHDSNLEKAWEHRDRARLQRVAEECLRKAKKLSSGNQTEIPGCKVTSSGLYTTITFRLSDYIRFRESERLSARENDIKEANPRPSQLCSTNSSLPAGFGLCHHQGHMQKFYSNGNKFLTALPDGTAQIFYPSGNLAIIAFIDDTEGVCIVLDDLRSSSPIRAFFQSSGIADCYHSNGSTWLHMDAWGGLSLNEDRSRRSKWKWTDNTNNLTPFKPIFQSLNKNIGVRVRGQGSVFVTFLASGQHARFSVGSCIKPSDPTPSLRKDELMLQVSQVNARLALERLRWCLDFHSDASRRSLRLPPGLISEGQRLLRLSSSIRMEEKDKAYIQHCLQDCQ
ncbi:glutamate-rich protein 6 isoform X2 [Ictalurus punctatus]|uniref:Glutamate-rich protein 6 isoform X2 n=1 Tax=Ictalurus punctatus TaxID=7998 RepID=A0A9F7TLI8_ICTPU|nr:glutamate-rich protein 6 isoform X2 [Ictalurus punctatus]